MVVHTYNFSIWKTEAAPVVDRGPGKPELLSEPLSEKQNRKSTNQTKKDHSSFYLVREAKLGG